MAYEHASGQVTTGADWTMVNGDSCEELPGRVVDESVDLSVYSPPFLSLFTYTASERDMGVTSRS